MVTEGSKKTMRNPAHRVSWRSPRPEFSINHISSTSTSRGYHETYFEVISCRALDQDAFKHLDEVSLLGMGQCYDVFKSETFTEECQPVTTDAYTGKVLPDVPPMTWDNKPFWQTHTYTWYRYQVRRICDSGD